MKYWSVLFIAAVLAMANEVPAVGEDCESTRPMLLVYCQGNTAYGAEVAGILQDDPRIEAEILVLTDPELVKTMLYFPYVKAVVAIFNYEKDEGLGQHLERFFQRGGGIVGIGYAGHSTTTRNASRTVFALAGNYYAVGEYNAEQKAYQHHLYVASPHEISQGMGNFTANTHKVIMFYNRTTGNLVNPELEGRLTVLYREPTYGAPVIVAYEDAGACVTFACFAGDALERAPTYFGRFTQQDGFKTLLRNSVIWVWAHESGANDTRAEACSHFAARRDDMARVAEQTERLQRRAKEAYILRSVLVIAMATLGVGVVGWKCFLGPKSED